MPIEWLNERDLRAFRLWAPLTAGLLAGGMGAWLAARAALPALHSPSRAVVGALWLEVITVGATLAALSLFHLFDPRRRARFLAVLAYAALSSLWMAPACVLLLRRSRLAVVAAGVLTVCLVELFRRYAAAWKSEAEMGRAARSETAPVVFSGPLPSVVTPHLVASFLASVLLFGAGVTMMAGSALPATVLLACAAVCLLAVLVGRDPGFAPQLGIRQRAVRACNLILLALSLTSAGLVRWNRPLLELGFGGGRSAAAAATDGSFEGPGGKSYVGVLLFPDEIAPATIVAPAARGRASRGVPRKAPELVSFPFFGAYWFFKAPDRSLPPSSVILYGTPDEDSFRTADNSPLLTEAHQNLGRMIDLACCESIRMTIRNADRYAGTVAVELLLINTALPRHPRISLGRVSVQSRPWSPERQMKEVLVFRIPAQAVLSPFDEIAARFHLGRVREARSARISIERFTLVPKGG